jgi:hypothetical protein
MGKAALDTLADAETPVCRQAAGVDGTKAAMEFFF